MQDDDTLLIKLNNVKLYEDNLILRQEKEKNIDDKLQAKELILKYKEALDQKNIEISKIQKEKIELEEKFNKIPEFVRNFFGE